MREGLAEVTLGITTAMVEKNVLVIITTMVTIAMAEVEVVIDTITITTQQEEGALPWVCQKDVHLTRVVVTILATIMEVEVEGEVVGRVVKEVGEVEAEAEGFSQEVRSQHSLHFISFPFDYTSLFPLFLLHKMNN